jgi:hypothetical protein
LRPAWDQFSNWSVALLVALLVGPILLGIDIFAWPRDWAKALADLAQS